MDELSQLDELIESDILEALGQNIPKDSENDTEINIENFDESDNLPTIEEEINIENFEEEFEVSPEIDEQEIEHSIESTKDNSETIQKLDGNLNTVDLASLLSQLLTNKTIEITIKIKD